MTPATQDQANAFAAHMARRFACTIIRKQAAIEMQWLSVGFDLATRAGLRVPDGPTFLERYATTVGPMIYVPDGYTPDQQIEVLTHECQHVHQFWHGGLGLPGGPGLWWLYLAEPEARVRYEADAYRAGLEVAVARTGQLPSLDALVWPLEGGYALSESEVQLGRDMLEAAATSVAAGLATTEAGRVAIEWIERNAPVLLDRRASER